MDFSELMQTLLDLQTKFPDLRWDVSEGMERDHLSLHMTIPASCGELLRQGRQMFSA